jgi:ribosomal protein L40E
MEIIIIALLGILVVGAVLAPLIRGPRGHHEDAREFAVGPPSSPPTPAAAERAPVPVGAVSEAAAQAGESGSDAALEAEIARYREAVRAGTVCRRCGEANPPDAKFCKECGKPLSSSDDQEFAK